MADLLGIYRHATRARLIDERLTQLARAGRIGFHPDARGFEPALAAAVLALGDGDHVFPGAREHAVFLARGMDTARYLAHALGAGGDRMLGHAAPGQLAARDLRVASPSGLVSNHLTHAAGCAWAARLRGGESAVLALFGRSAADAGDFHSGVNFAGATKAPAIFFCRTDRRAAARGGPGAEPPAPIERVADKAIAYGVEHATCDAADPASVAAAVAEARARGVAGGGPTLIEAVLEGDADPLATLEAALSREGAWDESRALELRRALMGEIETALAHVLEAGAPPRDAVFAEVYGRLPTHLAAQRDQLLAAPAAPAEGDR